MKIIETEWLNNNRNGPRPASRADLLSVLSNLKSILIRATLYDIVRETSISDVTLDTAVAEASGENAESVEKCRCPSGYSGTSCEVITKINYFSNVMSFNQQCDHIFRPVIIFSTARQTIAIRHLKAHVNGVLVVKMPNPANKQEPIKYNVTASQDTMANSAMILVSHIVNKYI